MLITQKPSPNQDGNRVSIDRIVIHWIVGNLATADAVFSRPGGTSAHYGIEDGNVHQYVQENKVAYHAGNYPMNQRSIGIEHSAAPGRPASDQTYQTSGELIAQIAKRHNIPLDRAHIIKHSEVVPTQCCGTVDVDRLISIAKSFINSTPLPPGTIPENISRKSRFFDMQWHDLNGNQVDTDKVTEDQVKARMVEAKSEKHRGGLWDQTCRKAGFNGNTEMVTVDQLIAKIRESGPANCEKPVKDAVEKIKTEIRPLLSQVRQECQNDVVSVIKSKFEKLDKTITDL